jgi:hypothetical protein
MENTGFIAITITGSKGNTELSPDNFDIREIAAILDNAEKLLYPTDKKDRPVISYNIKEGSVKNLLKTALYAVVAFNATIEQIHQTRTIDSLQVEMAEALENIQKIAEKQNLTFDITTSLKNTNAIKIDATTQYYRKEDIWVDAEFYFYGEIVDAGGKGKVNIHIDTEEYGCLTIQTPVAFLKQYAKNILYKTFGIRARGKQHLESGEIDTKTLDFIELIDYNPKEDKNHIDALIEEATRNWSAVENKNSWLKSVRGGYDA